MQRCEYLFQLVHYDSADHALAAATKFAAWTMANGDFLGMRGNDVFIEVTAECRQSYIEFVSGLYATIRRDGKISPQTPPALRILIDEGLDLKALLEKHPPIPAPPVPEA